MAKVQSQYPHIEWLDINGDGTLTECAIMKKMRNGDVYFFPVTALDEFDRQRLFNIITNRNARMYELWDLMSQVTLGNGVNALEYFHQLVKVLTSQGQVINPSAGRMGAGPAPGTYYKQAEKEAPKAKKKAVKQAPVEGTEEAAE